MSAKTELEKLIAQDLEKVTGEKITVHETEPVKQDNNVNPVKNVNTNSSIVNGNNQAAKGGARPGAGRHKANCNCEKCEFKRQNPGAQKPTKEIPVLQGKGREQLNDFLNKFPEKKIDASGNTSGNNGQPNQQQPQAVHSVTPKISGYVLMLVTNAIAPVVVVKIMCAVNPKAKEKGLTPSKIKFTKEQRQDLEPLADEVAKILFENMHPFTAFGISVGFTLFGNAIDYLDEQPNKKR